jgi:diguanylate cyclase (GGDEF)-like protein
MMLAKRQDWLSLTNWIMDYGTFFFTNIVSMTVFASCLCLLTWHHRNVPGVRWFAGAVVLILSKLILQGLERKTSVILTSMVANELYLTAFTMQLIGLRWFVRRRPFRYHWPTVLTGGSIALYTAMFLAKIPYSGNVINGPGIAICAASAWLLFRHGRAPVSRVSAVILAAETIVMSYRAWLTNLNYMRPWAVEHAETDPRWLYSLAAMALLTTCMVMCYLWFLVTELGRELAELARTDPLTGALNRRAMEEAALRETTRSIRHRHPLCMIVLDVDHFKVLNDRLGHAAGDCALQALVREVKTVLRSNDLLARTGGEEFAILLPDTCASTGLVAAERVRQVVEALEVRYDNGPIRFTVSVGVAQFDSSEESWESMMRRADSAMYEAKGAGRNTVRAISAPAVAQTAYASSTRVEGVLQR